MKSRQKRLSKPIYGHFTAPGSEAIIHIIHSYIKIYEDHSTAVVSGKKEKRGDFPNKNKGLCIRGF